MKQLSLSLLGPLQLTLAGTPIISFESDKVRALLFYLVVEADRAHRREALAGLLWPDQPERIARHSLSQALFNLRQALADHHVTPPFLLITRQTIQFNCASEHWIDSAAFGALLAACDRHCRQQTCSACAERLAQAAGLYRGSFLQQFSVVDSIAFEEWALLKRERLHHQMIDVLDRLAGYNEGHAAHAQARQLVWRQLELDPWREEAHRTLMRLLALDGQRSAALAQYEVCRRVLADELGVDPEPETIALYEQIQSAEQEVSPRLEALPTRMHHLPMQPTSFIGRDDELAELKELLANPACRLVTIVGPGGIGKTRLALAAAEQTLCFADGVCFVPLASSNSAEFLASTIADALGLSPHGQHDPKEHLLRELQNRDLLLVLDNFEHLLAYTDLLIDILRHVPTVKLLVTSRERLNIQWEWLFDIEGLTYPAGEWTDELGGYSAVQLFAQRASRVQRSFALTHGNAPAVVSICRLVAGIPLGIELAAAAVRERSCQEIAHHIAVSIDSLTTALRDVPARHRSLRAVFDHSWWLLVPKEQDVLRCLAVFRGGFAEDAAEKVAGASPPLLSALADKSLLHPVEASGSHRRYDMHEVVRQYGYEHLQTSEANEQVHERHLCYFLKLVEEVEPKLTGAEQGSWLQHLEAEYDNIRAGLGWALDRRQTEQAARLSAALWRFWTARGHLDEGREWLQRVQSLALALPVAIRAKVYVAGSMLAWGQADYSQAVDQCEHALALYREADDTDGIAACLQYLGSLTLHQGEYERSASLLEASLVLRREQHDRHGIALCLANLGALAGRQGDDARAQQCYEESLALLRDIGDQERIAVVLDNLGAVARDRGDYERARMLYEEGLALLRVLNNRWNIPTCLNNLGGIALDQHAYRRAMALFSESLPLLQALGDKEGLAVCLAGLAGVAGGLRHPERAACLYGAAEALRLRIGSPLSPIVRVGYDRSVAATRAQLSPVTFVDTWNRGRGMTLEQAIAFALDQPS